MYGVHTGAGGRGAKKKAQESEMSINLNPFTERHLMYFLNKALIRVTKPLCSTLYTAHK